MKLHSSTSSLSLSLSQAFFLFLQRNCCETQTDAVAFRRLISFVVAGTGSFLALTKELFMPGSRVGH